MHTLKFLLAGLASLGAAIAAPRESALPLVFIPNHGQTSPSARFMVKGSGMTMYFAQQDAIVQAAGTSVRMEFVDATGPQSIEGTDPLPGQANFLIGAEDTWRLGLPMYAGLAYRSLYPGVDMVYHGSGRDLKSEFIVSPGADPARIRLRYLGADSVRVEEDGSLTVRFGRHVLHEDAPFIYQEHNGERTRVDGSFDAAGDVVSFIVGGYDRSLPLTIDPVVYTTLLGGSGADSAMSLAVDATGAAYLAGFTSSFDLPTANPTQNFNAGGNEIFVAKLNVAGNGLVYCTYIGGRGDDRAYGIGVDAAGAAYVTGSTTSTNFPIRGALQTKLGGSKNAFVLKLSAAGNALVYSTYLGGNGSDVGNGIALDAAGNAYVAGDTTSINFPATAFQRSNRGAPDAFVAKVAADGSRLVYSTYLGGSSEDHAMAIAVGATGSAVVTGSTYSTNFPTANAYQAALAGGQDAFVTKLSEDGQSLIFSTYLGGRAGTVGATEGGDGIALDAQGNVYVAGETSSVDFPIRSAAQTTNAGWQDAFATKLSASGALIYSTYLGGPNIDRANAVAVDAAGNAYIAGETTSANLAAILGTQNSSAGSYDAFLVKLAPAGSSVAALVYMGGNNSDTATAVVADSAANIYLAGWTQSTNLPVVNGFQTINGGNYSAFLAKLNFGGSPAVLSIAKRHTGNFAQGQNGATYTVTVSNTTGAGATTGAVTVTETIPAGMTLASMAGTGWTCANGGNTCTRSDSLSGGSSYPPISVVVNVSPNASTQITNQVSVTGGGSSGASASDVTNIVSGTPNVVSFTPSSGSGASQTFSAVFNSPGGASAFTSAYMLISSVFNAQSSCYVSYGQSNNGLYLVNDAASAQLGPITPGSAATLQNSQCTLNGSGSSVTLSGNTLTLTASVTFKPAFAGGKTIFIFAYTSSSDTGFQTGGTWTVTTNTGSGPPTAGPLTPASGAGASQTFNAAFTNPGGSSAFTSAYMLVNSAFSSQNSCYVSYQKSNNGLYLVDDAASAQLGPITPGSAATLQNSQCTLDGSGSSVTLSGNTLNLTAALIFKPVFAGVKTVFLFAYTSSAETGFQTGGSWTVTVNAGSGPPTAGPLTPASGSGPSQTFKAAFANPAGASAFTSAYMLINSAFDAHNSCYVSYQKSNNSLYLMNDAASAQLGPVTPGSAASVQNSQCALNGSGSSVTLSGNTLTLTVSLTFKTAFAGRKIVYIFAYTSSADTGFQTGGSWTVTTGGAASLFFPARHSPGSRILCAEPGPPAGADWRALGSFSGFLQGWGRSGGAFLEVRPITSGGIGEMRHRVKIESS